MRTEYERIHVTTLESELEIEDFQKAYSQEPYQHEIKGDYSTDGFVTGIIYKRTEGERS